VSAALSTTVPVPVPGEVTAGTCCAPVRLAVNTWTPAADAVLARQTIAPSAIATAIHRRPASLMGTPVEGRLARVPERPRAGWDRSDPPAGREEYFPPRAVSNTPATESQRPAH